MPPKNKEIDQPNESSSTDMGTTGENYSALLEQNEALRKDISAYLDEIAKLQKRLSERPKKTKQPVQVDFELIAVNQIKRGGIFNITVQGDELTGNGIIVQNKVAKY
jgi:hypothetical protein